ncbi:MAG TPA: MFS transporter [Chloroflexota bacterium]|nr:MFS transporter [Chloroflexota bacterium]
MFAIPWVRYLFVALLTSTESIAYILIPPYLQRLGFDYALIGMLVGITGVASLGSRFPSGLIYRRQRAQWLTSAALALVGVTFLCFPSASNIVWIALALGAIGLGSGVATTVNMAMFMDVIPGGADKHNAMSFYAATISFGHLIGGLIGGNAADAFGFVSAFQLAAASSLGAIGILWLDRLPRAAMVRRVHHDHGAAWATRRERFLAVLRLFAEPRMVAISMVAFLLNFLSGIVGTFFPLFGISMGMSLSQVAVLKSVHSLTNTFARPLAGAPIRILGADRASYIGLALLAGFITLLPGQTLFWAFAALLGACGLIRAIVMVANTVVMADLDEARISRGTAAGFCHSSKDVGSLSSPAVCGWVASAAGLGTMLVVAPIAAAAVFFGVVGLTRGRTVTILEPAAPVGT